MIPNLAVIMMPLQHGIVTLAAMPFWFWLWYPVRMRFVSILRSLVRLVLSVGLLGLTVAVVGALARDMNHFTDLAAQAAFQFGLIGLALSAGFLALRIWLESAAALALAGAALLLSYVPSPVSQCTQEDETIRLVFFNLWVENHETVPTTEFLIGTDADILVLTELSYQFRDHFARLRESYPYSTQWLDGREWVGILSRYPMNNISERFAVEGSTEHVKAGILETDQGPMVVIGAHLTRPWPFNPPEEQLTEARALSEPLKTTPKPKIIVGDFNAVAWGRIVRIVTEPNGLKALPSAGTWPTFFPRPGRIAIDQALIGAGFACATKKVGPTVGSDHKPIIVEFSLSQD